MRGGESGGCAFARTEDAPHPFGAWPNAITFTLKSATSRLACPRIRPCSRVHVNLHFGSDSGGERGAAIFTLVGTAKLNVVDPEAYLRHAIARIADASGQSQRMLPRFGRMFTSLSADKRTNASRTGDLDTPKRSATPCSSRCVPGASFIVRISLRNVT